MRVYLFGGLFFVFFSRGDRIDPAVLESCKRAHSNGNEKSLVPFLKNQKIGGHLGPLPH